MKLLLTLQVQLGASFALLPDSPPQIDLLNYKLKNALTLGGRWPGGGPQKCHALPQNGHHITPKMYIKGRRQAIFIHVHHR